jgi:hypothetical protein
MAQFFAPEQEALCNEKFQLHNRPSSGAKNAQNAKAFQNREPANDCRNTLTQCTQGFEQSALFPARPLHRDSHA